jgi:hypothetical protein
MRDPVSVKVGAVRSLWLGCCVACSGAPATPKQELPAPVQGSSAPVIDRFSARAGHLMVRGKGAELPGPDQPIDLDRPPFITQGLAPDGASVRYYNFDVQSDLPATLYRFTRAGAREPIAGQLDVVDTIPGEAGYSDFWRISWVEVPPSFVPGSITNAAQVRELPAAASSSAINCPIVPRGSTAREARGVPPAEPVELWYRDHRVTCLRFGAELSLDGELVPTSPIYVTFGSEASFRTEPGTPQTHNVVLSLPGDLDYSPLWDVHIYDRSAFDRVRDANTALAAPLVKRGPKVNCPIVFIGDRL